MDDSTDESSDLTAFDGNNLTALDMDNNTEKSSDLIAFDGTVRNQSQNGNDSRDDKNEGPFVPPAIDMKYGVKVAESEEQKFDMTQHDHPSSLKVNSCFDQFLLNHENDIPDQNSDSGGDNGVQSDDENRVPAETSSDSDDSENIPEENEGEEFSSSEDSNGTTDSSTDPYDTSNDSGDDNGVQSDDENTVRKSQLLPPETLSDRVCKLCGNIAHYPKLMYDTDTCIECNESNSPANDRVFHE